MRLIDADEFLEKNKELADCDFIHPKYCDTLRDLVNNAPTVDVLDNIRAEIEHEGAMFPDGEFFVSIDRINEIIDKYKTERG